MLENRSDSRTVRILSMSPLVRRVTLAIALAGAAAAPAQDTPAGGLYGKIKGNIYTAPGGIYKVTIPVLPELGGQIHDTENVVTFDDSISTHVSIASFPLDAAQKWEYDTRGVRDYLAYFYANFVLPDFQARYPGAKEETTLFVPEFMDGAVLGFALLPGGSFFEGRNNILDAPLDGPAVAKRGNLLFVRNGRVFVVTAELAERVTQRSVFHKTPKEENEILRTRLMDFVGRMEFPSPKTAAARKP
jgi:hypothetical protein